MVIEWKMYDPNNPPELGKDYLISDGDGVEIASLNNYFQDEDEFPTWYPGDCGSLYHDCITHYAEINFPKAIGTTE